MISKISTVVRILHRITNCIMPAEGLKNRKLLKSYSGFEHDFYLKFWRSAADVIGANITDIGYGYFKIEYQNKKTYVNDSKVMLDNHVTLKVAGNKPLVLKMLQNEGLNVPQFIEYDMTSLDEAQYFLESTGKKMVVKPASGTGSGNGVTTHIDSIGKLKKASLKASYYAKNLLIEEQIDGDSYRLLYIGGEFVDCIRRDPPSIIGNGIENIKDLINKENDRRIGAEEYLTFHPLVIDLECKLKLKDQGLKLNYIPNINERVVVKSVVNQNNCFDNHICREDVHADIISIGKKVVDELGIELGGIDVITKNISIPLEESQGIINEVNTTPGLHIHVLVSEKTKVLPIGELVLKYIFDI